MNLTIEKMVDAAKACAAVTAILGAVGAAWFALGPYRPALSQDVQKVQDSVEKVEKDGLETKSEVLQGQIDDLTVLGARLKATPGATFDERNLVNKKIEEKTRSYEIIQKKLGTE